MFLKKKNTLADDMRKISLNANDNDNLDKSRMNWDLIKEKIKASAELGRRKCEIEVSNSTDKKDVVKWLKRNGFRKRIKTLFPNGYMIYIRW